MNVTIQLLDHNSSTLLSNLALEVFDHEIKPGSLHRFLEDDRHVMYLAIESNLVVGMISAVEYFHPDKPSQLWINEIGVGKAYRRKGIGKLLIDAMIEVAKHRGCAYAWLGTDKDNAVAQACFNSVSQFASPQPFLLYEWESEGHW